VSFNLSNRAAAQLSDERARDKAHARWRYLPRLGQLLWSLGPREVVLLGVFSVISGLLPVLVLVVLRRLIDSAIGLVTGTRQFKDAAWWLLALLAVSFCHELARLAQRWLGDDVQERLKARAQERLMTKAGRLSLAAFERPAFYDQLQRAQQGLDTGLFRTMENLFPLPAYLVTAASLLLYVGTAHILFPFILLLGLVPTHLAGQRFAQKLYRLEHAQTAPQRMLRYLSELLTGRSGAAEIRLFGLQAHLLDKRERLFRNLQHERLRLARAQLGTFMRTTIAEQLTYGCVIAGVVALVAIGRLSVGYLAAYLGAAERFRDAVSFLLFSTRTVDNDLRYIRDLLDYLEIEEESPIDSRQLATAADSRTSVRVVEPSDAAEIKTASENIAALTLAPTIRFEGVSFNYPGTAHPVLTDINFTLHSGEHIALAGANGAGKTTLAKLLLGLYQPTAGRITINGVPLSELEPRSWRAHTAAVFQDYVRYELSARENIGFGDLRYLRDDAAIRAAAAKSGADQVVAHLPAAYETVLGRAYDERGQDLSTGQWQKLALARAYLRDALVLVLDEPTAALDARTEVDIYRRFHDLSRGRSVLLVSHRLGAARLADRILFLASGRIVEAGSHAELLAHGGRYAEMYAIQAKWYQ
jgi:ATP-binding cassette, subfamily B, bacterial